ncbi:MAG: methyltransferase domain-containing protein [Synergistaceae bacterium]|jgi:hypothetical protein|nr:methyltransferase domain-containing protein [Synergistaceae bacterium]
MLSKCRFCGAPLSFTFIDLASSPLSNSYINPERIGAMEPFYPLHVYVCERCFLVQLEEFESPQSIFGDYAYFSSFSTSWLDHAKRYTEKMVAELSLNTNSQVVEIASNDGYLLQYFKERNIPVLGVEPAKNVAAEAVKKGIPTETEFFGAAQAAAMCARGIAADLMTANNVLAHVPDINDFVEGFRLLLAKEGIITFEFPHLLRLIEELQFDTIYHEHFSYLSLSVVMRILQAHELRVFKVEELPTHGGSLRLYVCHRMSERLTDSSVSRVVEAEHQAKLDTLEGYMNFELAVQTLKRKILGFLIQAKDEGKAIAAYGAPAKGNTLLNYCGIRTDFIDYTVDRSPAKQDSLLPGSRIPVYAPEKIFETRPDYVVILPWNLKDEISGQMAEISRWGGKFVTFVPNVEVW